MSFAPFIAWLRGPLTPAVESAFLRIIDNEALSSIFKIPVLEAYAHDVSFCQTYSTNIKKPCAFNNILANLKGQYYTEIGQISYHFLLITYNSVRFNIKADYTLEQALRPRNSTPIIEATGRLYNEILRIFQANVFEGKITSAKAKHFNEIFNEVERNFSCPVDMKHYAARKHEQKHESDALDVLFAPHLYDSSNNRSSSKSKSSQSNMRATSAPTPASAPIIASASTGTSRPKTNISSPKDDINSISGPPKSSGDGGSGRSTSKNVTFDLQFALDEPKPVPGALNSMNNSTASAPLTLSSLKEPQSTMKRSKSVSFHQKSNATAATPNLSQTHYSSVDTGFSSTSRSKLCDTSKDPIRERNMRIFNCAAYLMSYSNEKRAHIFAQIRSVLNIDNSVRDIDLNVLCKTELQLREVLNIIEQG